MMMDSIRTAITPYLDAPTAFISRHKNKIIAAAAVGTVVTGYQVYKKLHPIYQQVRSELRLMEQLSSQMEASERTNRRQLLNHRFEHNMNVGDVTLQNFAMETRKQIMEQFDIDALRKRLKIEKSRPELWDQFKVQGFARTLSSVYAIALLNTLIKVQLSIVSRYVLADQKAAGGANGTPGQPAPPTSTLPPGAFPPQLAEEVNKCYFSLSNHAQTTGLHALCSAIHTSTQHIMSRWSLGDMCSEQQIHDTIEEIQQHLITSYPSYTSFIFPSRETLSQILTSTSFPSATPQTIQMANMRLNEMVEETLAILSSVSMSDILTLSINTSLPMIEHLIQGVFRKNTNTTETSDSTALISTSDTIVSVPFANTMIEVTNVFRTLLPDGHLDNSPLFRHLSHLDGLKQLCSIIYFPIEDEPDEPVEPVTTESLPANHPQAAFLAAAAQQMKGLPAIQSL